MDCAKIIAVERSGGQFWVIEITQHAKPRVDLQFAGFACRYFVAITLQPEIDTVGRTPDGAKALRLIVGRKAEIARAGFGEAVEIVNRHQRELQKRPRERRRQRLAAGQDRAQLGVTIAG